MNRFDLRHIQTYTKLQCVFKSNEIDEQRIFLADDTFSCGFSLVPIARTRVITYWCCSVDIAFCNYYE